jgi:hypothetical protein
MPRNSPICSHFFVGRGDLHSGPNSNAEVLCGAVAGNKNPDFRGFLLYQSPLTDSNRRPSPYHATSHATGRSPTAAVLACFCRFRPRPVRH